MAQMFFNMKKCKHMHLGHVIASSHLKRKIFVEIEKVKEENDLGVVVDNKLNFRQHVSSKVSTANRNLGIIFKTFIYLSQEIFLSLYKSMVRPHLEYASVIWFVLYKKITLENIQRRATRLVPAFKGLSYPERLKHIGLPTLEYRRERADVMEVFKILSNTDLANKDKFFKMATYRTTRGTH